MQIAGDDQQRLILGHELPMAQANLLPLTGRIETLRAREDYNIQSKFE